MGECVQYISNGILSVFDLSGKQNVDVIKMHLSNNILSTENKLTIIANCVKFNNAELLKLMLNNDVHEQIILDRALQLSAERGYFESAQLLLDYGADVQSNNNCAIIMAAQNGHTKMFKLFANHGADMYVRANSPLCRSAERGHIEIVKVLLENGADVDANGCHFVSPDYSFHNSDWMIACKGYPLWCSIQNGHQSVAELLIRHCADIHVVEDNALCYCARKGNLEMVQLLIECGANVSAKFGSALANSASEGHFEIAKALLRAGADPNAHEGIIISKAAQFGDIEMYQFLIDSGVNMYYGSGLHRAKTVSMLKLILGQNISDSDREHALNIAVIDGNAEFVDALLRAGVCPQPYENNDPLWSTCWQDKVEIVKNLLKYDAHLYCDVDGALRRNVRGGNIETVKILLEYGGNLRAHTSTDIMSEAILSGNPHVVELLLDNGISADVQTRAFVATLANSEHKDRLLEKLSVYV